VRIHGYYLPATEINIIVAFNDDMPGVDEATKEHVLQLWGSDKHFKAFRRLLHLTDDNEKFADFITEHADTLKAWGVFSYLVAKAGASNKDFERMKEEFNVTGTRAEFLKNARKHISNTEEHMNEVCKPFIDAVAIDFVK
jgi:hypothetical protein